MTDQLIVLQLTHAVYLAIEAGFIAGFGFALAVWLFVSFIVPTLHLYLRLYKMRRIVVSRSCFLKGHQAIQEV